VPAAASNGPARQGRWLALHPGSGSESKNWPEGSWRELVDLLLRRTDLRLLIVGGEAEGGRLQRLANLAPAPRGEVLMNAPLVQLARTLGGCAAFAGHDSGITHLAAAVGLPGLVLWGASREEVWRPPSPAMRILRHPGGLSGLPVDTVLKELLSVTSAA